MVICAVIGCSSRSERHKHLHFYRFPAVTDHQGKKDYELRKKRLDGFLAAVSRQDINYKSLQKHDYRVCSRHFVTGEAAKLYETSKPNWLPTLNLGHMHEIQCEPEHKMKWRGMKEARRELEERMPTKI